MALYRYYQRIGGDEKWVAVQASEPLDVIKPTFVTVLDLDRNLEGDETREELDAVKYVGPMYFDLDAEDITDSIAGGKALLAKLYSYGIASTDMEIFLSGKKGLHFLIPQTVFMEKIELIARLPAMYKELAFRLAVETVDFKVYTARRGRMLRTCHNIRENNNYRVPITGPELEALTPELYQQYCKAQRYVTAPTPQYRAKFALEFSTVRDKIKGQKVRKLKPVNPQALKSHGPTVEKLLRGEGLKDGVGFNKIALQLSIYAREVGWTTEQFIEAADGLIKTHNSDGNRYNSAGKRTAALRDMFYYVQDNPGYEYSIDRIKALAVVMVKNAEGEEVPADEHHVETFSNGVTPVGHCYMVSRGEQGDAPITNFIFEEVSKLLDPETGSIIGLSAKLVGDGAIQDHKRVIMFPNSFTGSTALHNTVAPFGGTFTGTDIHARGLFQIMLKTVSESHYLIDSEGINLVSVPTHPNPLLHEPFVVWADADGVRIPQVIHDAGVQFEFQGYPDARGVLQTDLTRAPVMGPWLKEGNNRAEFIDVMTNLFECQDADIIGKTLGWTIACFWRQLFHAAYDKFPLLHVYGQAGSGKTEYTTCLQHMFFYKASPPSITPNSSAFAFLNMVGGSGCIPVVLDEYKPHEMDRILASKYRALFRDAYNMKDTQRGGGNRTKESFNALNKVSLSGPIAFLSEALETETAVLNRSILVTMRRPAPLAATKSYAKFLRVQSNTEMMAIMGHMFATRVARSYTVQSLKDEFQPIFDQGLKDHMLRPGDDTLVESGHMTPLEYERRQNGNVRNVYNNCVAAFGMKKFMEVIKWAYPTEEEYNQKFKGKIDACVTGIFKYMEALSRNTVPEYIKVLQSMSDMTRLDANTHSQYFLVEGVDYNLSEIGGKSVLVLACRAAYNKYRAYMKYVGINPLYPNENAFAEGIRDIPQFIKSGRKLAMRSGVDTAILGAEGLYRHSVSTWDGKSVPQNIVDV